MQGDGLTALRCTLKVQLQRILLYHAAQPRVLILAIESDTRQTAALGLRMLYMRNSRAYMLIFVWTADHGPLGQPSHCDSQTHLK